MFETRMAEQLKRIFGLDKVTFDRPGESDEQECVFIDVASARPRVIDARQLCYVSGKVHVFVQSNKMPYGYLAKRLQEADPADTAPFFFGQEENQGRYRNIVERSLDFTYLFDSQYDPAIGRITSIDLSVAET